MKNKVLKILIVVTETVAILIPFSFFEREAFRIMGAVGGCCACVGGILVLVNAFLEIREKRKENAEKFSDEQKKM